MKYGTFFSQIMMAADLGEAKSPEAVTEQLVAKGLSATDVDSGSIAELGLEYVKKLHADFGIAPASMFHLISFEHKKPGILDLMKEDSKLQLERCAQVGSPLIMPVPVVPGPHESPEARLDALKTVTAYIQDMARQAVSYGITVVVENYSSINTPLSYISDIEYILNNVPDARYVLDTGNFWFGGTDLMTACKTFADKTLHVHLKDLDEKGEGLTVCGKTARSVAIGDGSLPVYEAIRHLNENGYDKVFTVEINHGTGILAAILKSLENLKGNFA